MKLQTIQRVVILLTLVLAFASGQYGRQRGADLNNATSLSSQQIVDARVVTVDNTSDVRRPRARIASSGGPIG